MTSGLAAHETHRGETNRTPVEAPAYAGLDGLLQTSARVWPDGVLFRDGAGTMTAAKAAAYSAALAAQFVLSGLRPGERILLVMAARTVDVLALAGALRAGLVPVLLPCGLGPVDLAIHAKASEAQALIGPTHLGAQDYGESYLTAAALSEQVRLVATLGPGSVDGAADFAPPALEKIAKIQASVSPPPVASEGELIFTFERQPGPVPPGGAPLVPHRQSEIFSAVLRLAGEARLNPSRPLISTLVPATFAGLAAGPYAALMSAASLTLHGPFEAAGFLRAYDSEPNAHLVVPAAIAPLLQEAGLTRGDASLILVSRFAAAETFALPAPFACERSVADLYALGETRLVARFRDGGSAVMPPELSDGQGAVRPARG